MKNAADDEPIFVLRAQDLLAPMLVRTWADWARLNGCPDAKCDEAIDLAKRMEQWGGRRKFPD